MVIADEVGLPNLSAVSLVTIGALHAAAGDEEAARESLVKGRDIAAANECVDEEALARGHLACLPGGDVEDALVFVAENAERVAVDERRDAYWLLFRATGDRAHLEDAKGLLDKSLAHVDDETRQSMLTNRCVNREIMAAWESARSGGA